MNVTAKLKYIDSDIVSQYLVSLGIENVDEYLFPTGWGIEDYKHYPNIEEAVLTFGANLFSGRPIHIVMDSDCDGACSAAIMYNFLIYCNVSKDRIIVHHHTGKQHGIKDLVEEIISYPPGLLIIPDAGTNDTKECKTIKEKGWDIIVCDHHMIEKKNNHAIIVNNQSPEVNNKYLSGAGVTYKFCEAVADSYKQPTVDVPDYCDVVAVSLVSDVCNLTSLENRTYMYYGLENINNPFLVFLFDKVCKRKGNTPESISWNIAPLANALARSDIQETKTLFFDALVGNITPEEALKKMRKVKRLQDEAVKSVVEEIEPELSLDNKVIVGFTEPENASFTGLICNKFTGKYGKPTILLRDTKHGSWSGSLRSPVPLATKINESGIATAQGHEEACGVIIKKKKLEEFKQWLESLDLSSKPSTEVVAIVKPEDITLNVCQAISRWNELWGHGIDSPTFYIETTIESKNISIFRKTTTTIKLNFGELSCLKFFASEQEANEFENISKTKIGLVVGELGVNEYNGVVTPQCIIKDYEIIKDKEESWEDLF